RHERRPRGHHDPQRARRGLCATPGAHVALPLQRRRLAGHVSIFLRNRQMMGGARPLPPNPPPERRAPRRAWGLTLLVSTSCAAGGVPCPSPPPTVATAIPAASASEYALQPSPYDA